MEGHWMIPIMAFVLVPIAVLAVAIAASVLGGLVDWIFDALSKKGAKR